MNKIFEHRITNLFLSIRFELVVGAQKNCHIEIVLLSTHNIRMLLFF